MSTERPINSLQGVWELTGVSDWEAGRVTFEEINPSGQQNATRIISSEFQVVTKDQSVISYNIGGFNFTQDVDILFYQAGKLQLAFFGRFRDENTVTGTLHNIKDKSKSDLSLKKV